MAAPVFEEELLDNYTDAELLAFINDSPPITTTREEAVRILSPNLVAKPVSHYWDPLDEVYAMKAARSAGVNAPEVRRVTRPDGLDDSWIIMERVRGLTVEQLWPNIGLWSTLCIAWQLRSAIRTFSSITSQTTGGLHSGKARSEWLEGRYGPARHATPDVFASYINWWLVNVPAWKPNPRPELFLSPSREHVLVHQDLVPRNLIVDADGKLWVIDWNRAGFYPAFMEVMGMDIQTRAMPWICEDTWAAWWGRLRWSLLRFIACGFTGKYKKAFSAMHVVSQRSLVYRLEKSPYSEQ